ncbi:DUF2470 domain-containing protein [Pycnococcus provasolii]
MTSLSRPPQIRPRALSIGLSRARARARQHACFAAASSAPSLGPLPLASSARARNALESVTEGVLCALDAGNAASCQFICDGASMLVDVEPSRAVASADMLPAKVCLHANARGKEACVVGIATRVEDEAEVEEARKLMKKRRVDKANGTMLRIVVDRVTVSAAGSPQEEVDAAAFAEAERDPLLDCAEDIIRTFNEQRPDDVAAFCRAAGVNVTSGDDAEVVDVDRLGLDVAVRTLSPYGIVENTIVRVPFERAVNSERDARSMLTMMAQVVWENERQYVPPQIAPVTVPDDEESS